MERMEIAAAAPAMMVPSVWKVKWPPPMGSVGAGEGWKRQYEEPWQQLELYGETPTLWLLSK